MTKNTKRIKKCDAEENSERSKLVEKQIESISPPDLRVLCFEEDVIALSRKVIALIAGNGSKGSEQVSATLQTIKDFEYEVKSKRNQSLAIDSELQYLKKEKNQADEMYHKELRTLESFKKTFIEANKQKNEFDQIEEQKSELCKLSDNIDEKLEESKSILEGLEKSLEVEKKRNDEYKKKFVYLHRAIAMTFESIEDDEKIKKETV